LNTRYSAAKKKENKDIGEELKILLKKKVKQGVSHCFDETTKWQIHEKKRIIIWKACLEAAFLLSN
jgi:hypothetical protein